MELSEHIKEHRARLDMSQELLAEAIFVSRQTISNWETDRTYPDVQSLLLLSNLFKVSVDSLIKGDVKEMKSVLTNEARRLNKFGTVMAICGTIAVVWAIATTPMDMSWPMILIPSGVFLIPAVISAGMVEMIKRDNQLVTYQSIEAFMRGDIPNTPGEKSQRIEGMWWVKLFVKTVEALVFGFCFGWGLLNIIQRLFG